MVGAGCLHATLLPGLLRWTGIHSLYIQNYHSFVGPVGKLHSDHFLPPGNYPVHFPHAHERRVLPCRHGRGPTHKKTKRRPNHIWTQTSQYIRQYGNVY